MEKLLVNNGQRLHGDVGKVVGVEIEDRLAGGHVIPCKGTRYRGEVLLSKTGRGEREDGAVEAFLFTVHQRRDFAKGLQRRRSRKDVGILEAPAREFPFRKKTPVAQVAQIDIPPDESMGDVPAQALAAQLEGQCVEIFQQPPVHPLLRVHMPAPLRPQRAVVNLLCAKAGQRLRDLVEVPQRGDESRLLSPVLPLRISKAGIKAHAGWRLHQHERHVVLIPYQAVNRAGLLLCIRLAERHYRHRSPRSAGAQDIHPLETQFVQPPAAQVTEWQRIKRRGFPRRDVIPGLGVAEALSKRMHSRRWIPDYGESVGEIFLPNHRSGTERN